MCYQHITPFPYFLRNHSHTHACLPYPSPSHLPITFTPPHHLHTSPSLSHLPSPSHLPITFTPPHHLHTSPSPSHLPIIFTPPHHLHTSPSPSHLPSVTIRRSSPLWCLISLHHHLNIVTNIVTWQSER